MPLKVYRFCMEGTLEEKILERAERKLYLDRMVIEQVGTHHRPPTYRLPCNYQLTSV